MPWKLRAAAIVGLALAVESVAACDQQKDVLTGKVKEIVDRTKTTRKTYALYSAIKAPPDNGGDGWTAEFHSGDLHRVETPTVRVIANCKAQTGVAMLIETGAIHTDPKLALTACGIDTRPKLISAEYWGKIQTPLGLIDRVRLVDADRIRTYDINDDGVILHEVIVKNSPDRRPLVEANAIAVEGELPEQDIFSQASLNRSVVPEKYKVNGARGAPPAPRPSPQP
jgi:hypothetical protein